MQHTVAILAQGTTRAGAVTQAFFAGCLQIMDVFILENQATITFVSEWGRTGWQPDSGPICIGRESNPGHIPS